MENFPDPQILSFTLVNKIWNFEGKSLLKTRGKLVCTIGRTTTEKSSNQLPVTFQESNVLGEDTNTSAAGAKPNATACENLMEFARDLEGLSVVPFFGLNINIEMTHPGSCPDSVGSAISTVTSAVPIRMLSFDTGDGSGEVKANCQAFLFFKQIQSSVFLQLKIFKVDYDSSNVVQAELPLLKKIVGGAPNLEEFHFDSFYKYQLRFGGGEDTLLANVADEVLDGSKALLVRYTEPDEIPDPTKSYLNRLAVVHFGHGIMSNINESPHWDVKKVILENSRQTLVEARLEVSTLALILRHGLIFRNLREISLEIPVWHHDHPEFMSKILCSESWKRCFPRLRTLAMAETFMGPNAETMSQLIGGFPNFEPCPTVQEPCPEPGIEELKLLQGEYEPFLEVREHLAAFLYRLCPGVKRVRLVDTEQNLGLLMYMFKSMEDLQIHVTRTENLDPVFCGLDAEEVKELEGKDLDYLKAVHIVPSDPTIAHLTG